MTKLSSDAVIIYTDGGCDPNPGIGGWAAVLLYKGRRRELSGGEAQSTNNRMELTAAISALETLTRPCPVVLYTDSEYVKNGITLWVPEWKRRNWKRKGGAVLNLDLWQRLDAVASKHTIDWRWLRGHAGHAENERCDELAAEQIARVAWASSPKRAGRILGKDAQEAGRILGKDAQATRSENAERVDALR